jgi:L-ascorbate metabolism protein UlaG (beta-lactamase superfamily)
MRITWLGWAGVEIEANGARVVIDPLEDPAAVFAWLGARVHELPLPDVVAAQPGALAGLLTHLHRDHADAAALRAALGPQGVVHEPVDYGGSPGERLAIVQADGELTAAGLVRRPVAAWTTATAGPFAVTALPAVDGTGDPQVSWLVEANGKRVLHLGDTMWHGWWWRIRERYGAPDVALAPINGPRLSFPHRRPPSRLPGAMEPEQAALAAELLEAHRLVPIHYGGYLVPGLYEPVEDPLERLVAATDRATAMTLGETIDV